jgi:acyl-CoA reductase-like NAD-dependent aldehyde dehydrogenase
MAGLLADATGLLVNGRWRAGGPEIPVRDKYTQQPFAAVCQAQPRDVDEAVEAAAAAAREPMPPARRHEILSAASRLLREHGDEICAAYVAETGFTPADAATELDRAVGTLRLSAEEALRICGEEVPVAATPGSEQRLAFTIRVPVGVVAAIAPFNAPLNTVAHKIGPAIAAGNAVVVKPASQTPLCSAALAQVLLRAGLPPGFLHLVCGPGATVGAALVRGTASSPSPDRPRSGWLSSSGQASPRRTLNSARTVPRSSPLTPIWASPPSWSPGRATARRARCARACSA